MSTSFAQVQTYFYTPALKSLVQQISHLAFFGDGISVVLGEAGSGKTSLAKELAGHFEQAHQYIPLSFSSEVELADCLEQLASELGLRADDVTVSAGELLSELRQYVQALVQDKKLVILSIDNAHFLDDQALGALISLLQGTTNANSGLHLIFFSNPGLDRRIDALQIIDVAAYDFLLPNFSPTELSSFLETFPNLQPKLNSSLVQKLWSGSKGIPGKALAMLGADAGIDSSPSQPESESGVASEFDGEGSVKSGFSLPLVHIGAIVLLGGVLLATLFVSNDDKKYDVKPIKGGAIAAQGDKDDTDESAAVSGSDEEDDGSAIVQAESVGSIDNESVATEGPVEEEKSVEDFAASETSQVDSAPVEDPTSMVESSSVEVAVSQSGVKEDEAPLGVAQANTDKRPEPTTKEASIAVESSDSINESGASAEEPVEIPTLSAGKALTEPEIFLVAQNPEFYTLQVVAASKKESLEAYMKRQSNRSSLYMYRGTRESKSWYVIVQGVYSSREAALNARRSLPNEQAKAGPWPRKMSSIQEEIEEFRSN